MKLQIIHALNDVLSKSGLLLMGKKFRSGVKMYEEKTLYEKITAREILNIIEKISFSPLYRDFRINNGSRGERDLIIQLIKEKYGVK